MCFIITFFEACYFATDLCNMFDRAWLWMLIFLYFRLSFPVYCHTHSRVLPRTDMQGC